jgi:hypothetical protein
VAGNGSEFRSLDTGWHGFYRSTSYGFRTRAMLVSIDYIDYKYIGFLSRLKIAASKELLSPFDLLLVKRTLVNANLLAKMNHSISLSSCSSLSKATELAGKGSSVRGDFGLVR